MPCIVCMFALYLLFPSPLILRQTPLLPPTTPLPSTTTSPTTVPRPSSFQASRAIPLSHISPTVLYLSIALGICCCYVNPIQMHSLSLSPLDYLFRYPMQPVINKLYKYYTAVNSAPC